MIEIIVNYWFIILCAAIALAVGAYSFYVFIKMPSSSQLRKVTEWLLYAVAIAEKKLGSGTGQLKLRYVYDMFIAKFPYLVKVISFESFSAMVDNALEKFEALLQENDKVKNYIEGE